jgi:S1-C subfamily serine protease
MSGRSILVATIAVAAVAALVIVPAHSLAGAPPPTRDAELERGLRRAVTAVRPSMVTIVGGAMRPAGFGAVVGDGLVLASDHVGFQPDGSGHRVVDGEGAVHELTVRARSVDDGVALLEVPGLVGKVAALDLELAAALPLPVRRGSLVASVGTSGRPVAAGMVSVLGRTISGQESFAPVPIRGMRADGQGPRRTELAYHPSVLQHDTLLSHGELGSVLVSSSGIPVGLNTSNVLHGISFAIDVHRIAEILPLLRAGEDIPAKERGFLGVATYPASVELLDALEVDGGVVVSRVMPGHAAGRGGILVGDLLLAVDGEAILDHTTLVQEISARHPGSRVEIRLAREGRILDVPLPIGSTSWRR